jgi:IS30 family transposase
MATAKHYAHLALEMRRGIENGVVGGRSLAWIAEGLGVDATSVSRELRRNRSTRPRNPNRSLRNDCAHRKTCGRRRICDPDCARKCSSCARCIASLRSGPPRHRYLSRYRHEN